MRWCFKSRSMLARQLKRVHVGGARSVEKSPPLWGEMSAPALNVAPMHDTATTVHDGKDGIRMEFVFTSSSSGRVWVGGKVS